VPRGCDFFVGWSWAGFAVGVFFSLWVSLFGHTGWFTNFGVGRSLFGTFWCFASEQQTDP
jgi:hypothetical protein